MVQQMIIFLSCWFLFEVLLICVILQITQITHPNSGNLDTTHLNHNVKFQQLYPKEEMLQTLFQKLLSCNFIYVHQTAENSNKQLIEWRLALKLQRQWQDARFVKFRFLCPGEENSITVEQRHSLIYSGKKHFENNKLD